MAPMRRLTNFFFNLNASNSPFTLDPDGIEQRLQARITFGELIALAIATFMTLGFAYIDASYQINAFPDYRAFLMAANGDFSGASGGYFYAHWFLPIFSALDVLSLHINYAIWGILNIAGVFFAARVFGGNSVLALISYQMLYVLFYGNIVGVIVGALALMWWSLQRGRWGLAGLGWIIACTKFQLGIPLSLALLLMADISWYARLRAAIVPLIVVLASVLLYPGWIETLYNTVQSVPADTQGNIALWQYFGPVVLLLWLPPLLLKMPPGRRLAMIAAVIALGLPYYQQTDLIALYVLPIGWLAVLGNIGYLFIAFQWIGLKPLIIIPAIVYGWALWRTIAAHRSITTREKAGEFAT